MFKFQIDLVIYAHLYFRAYLLKTVKTNQSVYLTANGHLMNNWKKLSMERPKGYFLKFINKSCTAVLKCFCI